MIRLRGGLILCSVVLASSSLAQVAAPLNVVVPVQFVPALNVSVRTELNLENLVLKEDQVTADVHAVIRTDKKKLVSSLTGLINSKLPFEKDGFEISKLTALDLDVKKSGILVTSKFVSKGRANGEQTMSFMLDNKTYQSAMTACIMRLVPGTVKVSTNHPDWSLWFAELFRARPLQNAFQKRISEVLEVDKIANWYPNLTLKTLSLQEDAHNGDLIADVYFSAIEEKQHIQTALNSYFISSSVVPKSAQRQVQPPKTIRQ